MTAVGLPRRYALAAACLALLACSRPVTPARLAYPDPPSEAEIEAAVTLGNARCSHWWGALFPGLGQVCEGRTVDGLILAGIAGAEISTAVAVAAETGAFEDTGALGGGDEALHPGVSLPLLALSDTYLYGMADAILFKQLAARELYTPTADLADLVAAPFNLDVLAEPEVWVGIAGALAIGLGASILVSETSVGELDDELGDDPNVFGEQLSAPVGYSLGGATFAGLFTHVAIAEEAMFRGVLQSTLARSKSEWFGWGIATLVFGAAHIPNASALEGDEKRNYYLYALPVITGLGGYMGWVYMKNGYTLEHPTAIHFWYDFLLSAAAFAVDPDDSVLSATVTLPF